MTAEAAPVGGSLRIAPEQLHGGAGVRTIARGRDDGLTPLPHSCVLHKRLAVPLHDAAVFTRVPSLSLLSAGEKLIGLAATATGEPQAQQFSLRPGEVLALSADLYQISDLLPETGGVFDSTILFLDPSVLREFVRTLPAPALRESLEPIDAGANAEPLRLHGAAAALTRWRESLSELLSKIAADAGPARHGDTNALLQPKLLEALQLIHLYDSRLAGWARLQIQEEAGRPPRDLRAFMLRHFERPLSVEDFARLTGRSPSTFLRDFKRSFGTTPREWLFEQRMQRASQWLASGELAVGAVAERLGYESVSHFIRTFKRRFGKTPGSWARAGS